MAATEVTVVGPVFAMSMDLLDVLTQASPGIIIPTRRGMKRAAVAGNENVRTGQSGVDEVSHC